jgi:hypothetical protein
MKPNSNDEIWNEEKSDYKCLMELPAAEYNYNSNLPKQN